jgi:hypothetical protein
MKRLLIAIVCALSLVAGSVWAAKPDKAGKPAKQEKVRPAPEDRAAMHAELRLLNETFRDEQRLAREQYRLDRQAIMDRYRSAPAPSPLPAPLPEPVPTPLPVPVEPPVP